MAAPPGYIANFDSATAMVRATARFLKGRDFPGIGLGEPVKIPQRRLNRLPRKAREISYIVGGANEGPSMTWRVRGGGWPAG